MDSRMLTRRLLPVALIATFAFAAGNADLPANAQGVLFDGWDPVSWFQPGKGQRGVAKFAAPYQGKKVWFASEANRKLFLATPARYLPEFGGRCALSLANGKVEKADPACYRKLEGKVYLFANERAAQTWEVNVTKDELVPTASSFFKRLLGGA